MMNLKKIYILQIILNNSSLIYNSSNSIDYILKNYINCDEKIIENNLDNIKKVRKMQLKC